MALLEGYTDKEDPVWNGLCIVPVKTVLRGYKIYKGYVVATTGFDYSTELGVETDPEDYEF